MSHQKNKVDWCLKKAEKELKEGKKHRGLVIIKPNNELAKEHIKKAEHNLQVTLYLNNGGYTDWCSSSLFYTIYHCFLAILTKLGYESRNQECTFALISSFIEDKKININSMDLEKISSLDIATHEDTAISIREKYQYNTKTSLENKEYKKLLELAKKILDQTKGAIQ